MQFCLARNSVAAAVWSRRKRRHLGSTDGKEETEIFQEILEKEFRAQLSENTVVLC